MKLVPNWSHVPLIAVCETYVKNICQPAQKNWREGKEEQKNGNYLEICVLNLLPKVTVVPSLVATSLVKVEISFFQFVTWTQVSHVTKNSFYVKGNSLSRK